MNIQEFSKYFGTLYTNLEDQTNYVPLPINDLEELGYMHQSLLDAIQLLSQERNSIENEERADKSVYWLTKIILASYPTKELEGLSEFLKQSKKI